MYHGVPDTPEDQAAMEIAVSTHRGSPGEYTQSITAAWGLFEEMRNSGSYCCLKLDSDYSYTYGVSLYEDARGKEACADFEAAQKHTPSLWLDVADVGMPLLLTVAYIWANKIKVPGVEMPWEKRARESAPADHSSGSNSRH